MRRRAWELGACLVEQQLQLFDILVQPVLSYGCELWGVSTCWIGQTAPQNVCTAGFAGVSKGSPLKCRQRRHWRICRMAD